MRRYIGAIAAVVIFGALLLFVLFIPNTPSASPTVASTIVPVTISTAQKELEITSLSRINQLELKSVTATLTMRLEGGGWKQTAPQTQTLDSGVISDTLVQYSNLKGQTLIPADKTTDLAVYGLDKPSLSVTLSSEVSSTKTLNFGLLNTLTNNYYVKLADDARIWSVSAFYVTTLQAWLAKPPTPAPTLVPVTTPQTPLPSIIPSPDPATTVAPPTVVSPPTAAPIPVLTVVPIPPTK